MPKLYKEPNGAWVVPGQQTRHAERIDVPNGPEALARWLNDRDQLANRAIGNAFETGTKVAEVEPVQERPTRSLSLEDEWEALPLALQLHFAALAVETARERIKP